MVSEDQAKQLHDRATRDVVLSPGEHSLLEEWYSFQDSVEHQGLGLSTDKKALVALRAQIDTLSTHLTVVTKRIQEISIENQSLKREITSLYRLLQGLA